MSEQFVSPTNFSPTGPRPKKKRKREKKMVATKRKTVKVVKDPEKVAREQSASMRTRRRGLVPQLLQLEVWIATIAQAIRAVTVEVQGELVSIPSRLAALANPFTVRKVLGELPDVKELARFLGVSVGSLSGLVARPLEMLIAMRDRGSEEIDCREVFDACVAVGKFLTDEHARRARMAGTTSTEALRADLIRHCRLWQSEIIDGRASTADTTPTHALPRDMEKMDLVLLIDLESKLGDLADPYVASNKAAKAVGKTSKKKEVLISVGFSRTDWVRVTRGMFAGKLGQVVEIHQAKKRVVITVGKTRVEVGLDEVEKTNR